MSVIYLNAAHTPRSPGGVYGGRTEHREGLRLCNALKREIGLLAPHIAVKISSGEPCHCEMNREDMLLVFHKAHNEKNEHKSGAHIWVKADCDCENQYRAYRLLKALCSGGLSYRRVHTLTPSALYGSLSRTVPERAFLVEAGYLDSERDCRALNDNLTLTASRLAGEIVEIYKEKKYEDIA